MEATISALAEPTKCSLMNSIETMPANPPSAETSLSV